MTTPIIVTSTSSDAQIEAAYLDNVGYAASGGSVAMAHAFRAACLALIYKSATSMTKGGNALSYDRRMLQDQAQEAWQWILGHQKAGDTDRGGPTVTRVDFGNFR